MNLASGATWWWWCCTPKLPRKVMETRKDSSAPLHASTCMARGGGRKGKSFKESVNQTRVRSCAPLLALATRTRFCFYNSALISQLISQLLHHCRICSSLTWTENTTAPPKPFSSLTATRGNTSFSPSRCSMAMGPTLGSSIARGSKWSRNHRRKNRA